MAITARDVATEAGVSVSTVSRALARPDLVSGPTRARVEAVAHRLNYEPNSVARGLSTGRTYHLGLLVPDLENPFFASVAKAVQSQARRLGYSVFIADTDEDATLETSLIHQLAPQVDGIIVASPRSPDDQVRQWIKAVPLVLLNRLVTGLGAVTLDNADGVVQAVRHLWALGHRTIAYAGGPKASWSDGQRRSAFVAAVDSIDGLTGIDLGYFQPFHQGGTVAADLALATQATAVLAYNDLVALGILERFTLRGVSVPGDISVIGTDNITTTTLVRPALTTVAIPFRRLGQTGLEILLSSDPSQVEVLPVELIVRASTGEAPSGLNSATVRTSRTP